MKVKREKYKSHNPFPKPDDWVAPVDHEGNPCVTLIKSIPCAGGDLAFYCRLPDGRTVNVCVDRDDGTVGASRYDDDATVFGGFDEFVTTYVNKP